MQRKRKADEPKTHKHMAVGLQKRTIHMHSYWWAKGKGKRHTRARASLRRNTLHIKEGFYDYERDGTSCNVRTYIHTIQTLTIHMHNMHTCEPHTQHTRHTWARARARTHTERTQSAHSSHSMAHMRTNGWNGYGAVRLWLFEPKLPPSKHSDSRFSHLIYEHAHRSERRPMSALRYTTTLIGVPWRSICSLFCAHTESHTRSGSDCVCDVYITIVFYFICFFVFCCMWMGSVPELSESTAGTDCV